MELTKADIIKALAELSEDDRKEIFYKKEVKSTYEITRIIKLRFGKMPTQEQKDEMKSIGFRWNGYRGCPETEKYWFATATDKAIEFAAKCGFEEAK